MAKHIPNILTIFRFILIPFIIIFLLQERYVEALIFLVVSGITDVLDGFIARKFNFITNFGKLVDPLADKATQISVLLTLTIMNIIPLWILIIVMIKEILMVVGAAFLYGKELVVSSKWYGKCATVLFYTAIGCSFVIRLFNIPLNFDLYVYYIALAFTIFSLFMYFEAFYRQGYLKKENLKVSK